MGLNQIVECLPMRLRMELVGFLSGGGFQFGSLLLLDGSVDGIFSSLFVQGMAMNTNLLVNSISNMSEDKDG